MNLIKVAAGRCQFCHRTAEEVAHTLAGLFATSGPIPR